LDVKTPFWQNEAKIINLFKDEGSISYSYPPGKNDSRCRQPINSHQLTSLPISGLFLKTEFRYSQYGGNGVNVPLTATAAGGGVPVTGAALNSQKATEFISTELVWRFNWFGR
jgi:hypothetical protein